jgi:hypothetical protein
MFVGFFFARYVRWKNAKLLSLTNYKRETVMQKCVTVFSLVRKMGWKK